MKDEVHLASWIRSTERKYSRRHQGECGIFFGTKHRLRKEEMEEQFNKDAKEVFRFAANAARITDETTGSADRKHTSGGVFVAVDSNMGAVEGAEEGVIESIPGNEGRIAQAWVNVRGGLRVFSVYFWHSEGWTPRNEPCWKHFLKQTRTTGHPWLMACDANMCPKDFEKSLWFQREQKHVVARKKHPRAG